MVQFAFDANQVDPNFDFEALPAGKYEAAITQAEMKQNKKRNGHYLELTFQVVSGEHKGRTLWVFLNVDNPSEKAVEIARKELSAICRACGVMVLKDTQDLLNALCVISVKVVPRKDSDGNVVEGEYSNQIKAYEARAVAPGQSTQARSDDAPWLRK